MFTLNCKGSLLVVDKPLVMAVINVTPDSFYGESRVQPGEILLQKVKQFMEQGADIIDIGGQSTRPGSEKISAAEEMDRLIPAIETIRRSFPGVIISADTYYSGVAKAAVDAGASIINDISGGTGDADMIHTVARLQVPYVLMHIPGSVNDIHQKPAYTDFLDEVLDYFIRKISDLADAGINDIIIDPGFGFGKSPSQNFELVKSLDIFKILNRPVLLGVSRKSTIYKTLGVTADDALNGSTVLHTAGLLKGADILRVHDVKEAKEAILLCEAIKKGAS